MQHDYYQKKMFWPLTQSQGSMVWVRTELCLYVNAFLIPLNLICNMTWFCKKVNFDPTPRVGGGGLRVKYCYFVAACVIHFNLICIMTMFWKRWILTVWPKGSAGKISTTKLLHASFPLIWYATWPNSEKV